LELAGWPVLIPDAPPLLAAHRASLDRQLADLDRRAAYLDDVAAEGGLRADLLMRMSAALVTNRTFLARLRELIGSLPEVSAIAASAPAADLDHDDLLAYFRRDWTAIPECLDEQATLEAATAGHLRSGGDLCAVLAAGTGRLAHALAQHFRQVAALDMSAPMTLAHRLVLDEDIDLYEVHEFQALSRSTVAVPYRASSAGVRRAQVHGAVADALHTPLATAACDAVVAAFFLDVVPLRDLLAEVRRILRPGGRFAVFGPLGYHFYRPEEMYSLEEARELVVAAGFSVVVDEIVPYAHLSSRSRLAGGGPNPVWSLVTIAD
jgi:SAM-dependent methyltransferase